METIKLTKEESFIVKGLIDSAEKDLIISTSIKDVSYHDGRIDGILELLDLLQFDLKILELYNAGSTRIRGWK